MCRQHGRGIISRDATYGEVSSCALRWVDRLLAACNVVNAARGERRCWRSVWETVRAVETSAQLDSTFRKLRCLPLLYAGVLRRNAWLTSAAGPFRYGERCTFYLRSGRRITALVSV